MVHPIQLIALVLAGRKGEVNEEIMAPGKARAGLSAAFLRPAHGRAPVR